MRSGFAHLRRGLLLFMQVTGSVDGKKALLATRGLANQKGQVTAALILLDTLSISAPTIAL